MTTGWLVSNGAAALLRSSHRNAAPHALPRWHLCTNMVTNLVAGGSGGGGVCAIFWMGFVNWGFVK